MTTPYKKSITIKNIHHKLENVVGMIGTKFNINNITKGNYQVWDCVTVKDSKIEKWYKKEEAKSQIVNYSKSSFFKTYPLNFNSSNMNPIISWAMGCQIAAINAQSNDDNVLINKVFFSLNRNNGYILKPKYLIDGKVKDDSKICYEILLEFISGVLLNTLSDESIKEMSISIGIRGELIDEKENETFFFKKIYEKFNNPNFDHQKFRFLIKNPYFSFVLLKIYSSTTLIGRSVIPIRSICRGFRNISVYSNELQIKEQVMISCLVNINEIYD